MLFLVCICIFAKNLLSVRVILSSFYKRQPVSSIGCGDFNGVAFGFSKDEAPSFTVVPCRALVQVDSGNLGGYTGLMTNVYAVSLSFSRFFFTLAHVQSGCVVHWCFLIMVGG